ncbi:MAG TPA: hypothetical protein DCX06_03705 [Opitutae bacterium]|nr:hypothetical protein [Opitutae bacterium]
MVKLLIAPVIFIFCLLLPHLVFAEFETFTNEAGQSLEAELLELDKAGQVVTLRMRAGNKIEARLDAFSIDDRKRIRKWWKGVQADKLLLQPDSRIEISAKMNRKSRDNARYDWYYRVDDKTKSFFPEVLIRNDELLTFKGNTIRVVIVAEDLEYKHQKLIVSASTMKSDFLDRGDTILESDAFRLRVYEYDSDYSNYDYAYGYEYEGYIVVIKNSKGEITHTRASKTKYLSNMKMIMNCKAGEIYDEDLNHKLNARPNSYFVQ